MCTLIVEAHQHPPEEKNKKTKDRLQSLNCSSRGQHHHLVVFVVVYKNDDRLHQAGLFLLNEGPCRPGVSAVQPSCTAERTADRKSSCSGIHTHPVESLGRAETFTRLHAAMRGIPNVSHWLSGGRKKVVPQGERHRVEAPFHLAEECPGCLHLEAVHLVGVSFVDGGPLTSILGLSSQNDNGTL